MRNKAEFEEYSLLHNFALLTTRWREGENIQSAIILCNKKDM